MAGKRCMLYEVKPSKQLRVTAANFCQWFWCTPTCMEFHEQSPWAVSIWELEPACLGHLTSTQQHILTQVNMILIKPFYCVKRINSYWHNCALTSSLRSSVKYLGVYFSTHRACWSNFSSSLFMSTSFECIRGRGSAIPDSSMGLLMRNNLFNIQSYPNTKEGVWKKWSLLNFVPFKSQCIKNS